jgi:hypothetical protein
MSAELRQLLDVVRNPDLRRAALEFIRQPDVRGEIVAIMREAIAPAATEFRAATATESDPSPDELRARARATIVRSRRSGARKRACGDPRPDSRSSELTGRDQ